MINCLCPLGSILIEGVMLNMKNIEMKTGELRTAINKYLALGTGSLQGSDPGIEKKLLTANFDRGNQPAAIVIHETDNESPTAGALNHYRYFNNPENQVSVHYVCDEDRIIQLLEHSMIAWHCGGSSSRYSNANTIGIEVCVNGDYEKARDKAIALTGFLMAATGIQVVLRHFDISGKYCPRRMLDLPELWEDFLDRSKALSLTSDKARTTNKSETNDQPAIRETVRKSGAESSGAKKHKLGIVNTDVLNVRSGRGTDFQRIGQLTYGTRVELLYHLNGWWSIDYGPNWGFVCANYIDVCEE